MEEKLLLTKTDAARLLGVGDDTLRQAVREGRIRTIVLGAKQMIPRIALDEFLAGVSPQDPAGDEGSNDELISASACTREGVDDVGNPFCVHGQMIFHGWKANRWPIWGCPQRSHKHDGQTGLHRARLHELGKEPGPYERKMWVVEEETA